MCRNILNNGKKLLLLYIVLVLNAAIWLQSKKKKRSQQMYFSKEIKLKNFLDLHKYNITNVDNVKRRLKKESTFALISVVRF